MSNHQPIHPFSTQVSHHLRGFVRVRPGNKAVHIFRSRRFILAILLCVFVLPRLAFASHHHRAPRAVLGVAPAFQLQVRQCQVTAWAHVEQRAGPADARRAFLATRVQVFAHQPASTEHRTPRSSVPARASHRERFRNHQRKLALVIIRCAEVAVQGDVRHPRLHRGSKLRARRDETRPALVARGHTRERRRHRGRGGGLRRHESRDDAAQAKQHARTRSEWKHTHVS